MRKIERLCSVRERSSSSLEERLIRDGFPEDVAANAVARAVECGLVDDGRFADVLVRSRIAAGKGCAGIARELASHGIEASTVESYVEATESGHDSEVARAVSFLNRKPPRAKNVREASRRRWHPQRLVNGGSRLRAADTLIHLRACLCRSNHFLNVASTYAPKSLMIVMLECWRPNWAFHIETTP